MKNLRRYLPQILLALPLLLGGGAKLLGVPQVHASFGLMGLPAWFGYFIGAAEVAGAMGLFLPRLRRLAAAGLVPIMAGAVFFHWRYTPWEQGIPALILLGLSAWLAVRAERQN
ncbi:DoxX family protein [Inhella gelatinilytica]|uniref:DoxX family protein n=1 Tax=Inhella gelatinilytica TaxID=2795030 RepID=A0A931NF26_9BURK|nr:DoxX family protein [Inhella gelatinilytica]MBH9554314.1 DoxX family protein [Inhella gelatinilytica]